MLAIESAPQNTDSETISKSECALEQLEALLADRPRVSRMQKKTVIEAAIGAITSIVEG